MSEVKDRFVVTVDGKEFDLYLSPDKDHGKYFIELGKKKYKIVADALTDKKFLFKIDNMSSEVDIVRKGDYLEVFLEGKEMSAVVEPYYLAELRKKSGSPLSNDSSVVLAPMPGLVLQVEVQPGDEVQEGQTLVIIEAMKMENLIKSSQRGVIKEVNVSAGQAVEKNVKLLEFD